MFKIKEITASKILHPHHGIELAVELADSSRSVLHIYSHTEQITENCIQSINKLVNIIIAPIIIDINIQKQREIDGMISELCRIHANETCQVNISLFLSYLLAKSAARQKQVQTWEYISQFANKNEEIQLRPVPIYKIIEGNSRDNSISFEDISLVPAPHKNIDEISHMFFTVQKTIEEEMKLMDMLEKTTDSGSLVVKDCTGSEVIELILNVINKTKYHYNKDIFIALNINAQRFYTNFHYNLNEFTSPITADALFHYYQRLIELYNPLIVEGAFSSVDQSKISELNTTIGDKTLLIENFHNTLSTSKISRAAKSHEGCGIVIDLNTIKTITDLTEIVTKIHQNNWKLVLSSKNSSLPDKMYSDLALGVYSDFLKLGANNQHILESLDTIHMLQEEFIHAQAI